MKELDSGSLKNYAIILTIQGVYVLGGSHPTILVGPNISWENNAWELYSIEAYWRARITSTSPQVKKEPKKRKKTHKNAPALLFDDEVRSGVGRRSVHEACICM